MTTKEAIQAMLDGKKVRQTSWKNPSFYIRIGDDGHIRDEQQQGCDLHNANNWEIYEEPAPIHPPYVVIETWLLYDEITETYYTFASSNIDKDLATEDNNNTVKVGQISTETYYLNKK